MKRDEVDLMLARVRALLRPDMPLMSTCALVLHECADMSDETFASIETVGKAARKSAIAVDAGAPDLLVGILVLAKAGIDPEASPTAGSPPRSSADGPGPVFGPGLEGKVPAWTALPVMTAASTPVTCGPFCG